MRSALAPYILTYFNSSKIKGDSALISFPVREFYRKHKSISTISTSGIGVAPGLAFTLVLKQLFFSATIFAGFEIQNQKYYSEDIGKWKNEFNIAPAADSRVSFGVNGNRAFAAITARNDVYNINFPNFKIKSIYSLVTIDFGYRFNAPGIVERSYEKVDKMIKKVKNKVTG